MARARATGKDIGRPQKVIDRDHLIKLLLDNMPRTKIAKHLGVSKATLYKVLRQIPHNNLHRS
jgi:putative DNA-invertase from lambdoid prophage Rac